MLLSQLETVFFDFYLPIKKPGISTDIRIRHMREYSYVLLYSDQGEKSEEG